MSSNFHGRTIKAFSKDETTSRGRLQRFQEVIEPDVAIVRVLLCRQPNLVELRLVEVLQRKFLEFVFLTVRADIRHQQSAAEVAQRSVSVDVVELDELAERVVDVLTLGDGQWNQLELLDPEAEASLARAGVHVVQHREVVVARVGHRVAVAHRQNHVARVHQVLQRLAVPVDRVDAAQQESAAGDAADELMPDVLLLQNDFVLAVNVVEHLRSDQLKAHAAQGVNLVQVDADGLALGEA